MPRWRAFWHGASILLPPFMLLVLAAFSWWVAREASRAGHGGGHEIAAPQQPDYFLQDFGTRSYDAQGQLVGSLGGASMRHYPGDDTVRIERPNLRAVGRDGTVTTAVAQSGISNADASNVQLIGQAVVRRDAPGQPELSVRSDFLNIFPGQQRVVTNRPNVVTRGASSFSGSSLEMDGVHGTFNMGGGVTGRIAPP